MRKHSGAQGPLSAPIWTARRVRTPSMTSYDSPLLLRASDPDALIRAASDPHRMRPLQLPTRARTTLMAST